MSTIALPQTIGKYEIRGLIGRGGMGVVYRGYDQDIDRLVAIKVLHPHLNEEGLLQRFRQEARAAARCVHRNIVAVFDFGTTGGLPFIAMEYVAGIDLRSFIKADGALTVRQSCEIILQVLAALEFAHGHGVVHRDIKPGNILLLEDGLVKVADFGVAKIDSSDLTSMGQMIGTPSYMSPEARAGLEVDVRSDLFSVGVMMLELICGARHEKPEKLSDGVASMLENSALGDSECIRFSELLDKAMAHDPVDRFDSARAFSDALKAILSPNAVYQPDTQDLAATVIETREQHLHRVKSAALESNSGSHTPATSLSLTAEATSELSEVLSSYLGPVAPLLIRKASSECETLDELVGRLSDKIPTGVERQQFIKALRQHGTLSGVRAGGGSAIICGDSSATGSQSASGSVSAPVFTPDQLDRITKEAVLYLGPLASRVVRNAAKRAADINSLYQMLAEQINSAHDRQAFLAGRPDKR